MRETVYSIVIKTGTPFSDFGLDPSACLPSRDFRMVKPSPTSFPRKARNTGISDDLFPPLHLPARFPAGRIFTFDFPAGWVVFARKAEISAEWLKVAARYSGNESQKVLLLGCALLKKDEKQPSSDASIASAPIRRSAEGFSRKDSPTHPTNSPGKFPVSSRCSDCVQAKRKNHLVEVWMPKMPDNHLDSRTCMAKLNEHCQRNCLKLEYKNIDIKGPPHDRIFTVAVVIDKIQYSPASGKSKKEAKAQAAELAWNTIEREKEERLDSWEQHQESKLCLPARNVPEFSSSNSVNYVSLLNEYALKNRVRVQYNLISKTGLEHKPVFSYVCQIGDKIFDVGTGNKVQTAKLEAAKLAYNKLTSQPTFRVEENANSVGDSSDMPSNSSQELSSVASGNSADLDSEWTTFDTFANCTNDIQPNKSLSSQDSPSQAMKSKRKETPLAVRFPNQNRRKSDFTMNTRFLKDFEIIEELGSGGFGNVFKAKHKIDNRLCAIKRIRISGKEENEEREVQALAKLDHQNIVRYYGCWTGKDSFQSDDTSESSLEQFDCLFIHMELCEKGNLKKWIHNKMRNSSCKDDSIIIFQQILEGVKHIHSENLIHRDLKPLNIFFHSDNCIKIGDFGLVTSDVNDFSVQRTMNKGTVLYMAPEQKTKKYHKEVDIFPLGLILYEMLSPFPTDHEKHKEWDNIREGNLPEIFNKKFTKEAALIKKMLSKEPAQRPSADDLLTFLSSRPYSQHTY